jgi:CRISPR/Cas system CSM-associated protein Csm3 (group 7 of RAMP superfamily)
MSNRNSREVVERIVIEGDLVLLTPTSLGNGDHDGLADMSLLLDEVDGSALLTGTTITGALRNYLRERSKGFSIDEFTDSDGNSLKDKKGKRRRDSQGNLLPLHAMTHLFGSLEDDGAQSLLIVNDAFSEDPPTTELRDGVSIDSKTRTAVKGEKFDIELLEAATKFKLRFELLITNSIKLSQAVSDLPKRLELMGVLAFGLQGFGTNDLPGEIFLGARKRRGYGECLVQNWTVRYYNLETKNGLLAWLGLDERKLQNVSREEVNLAKKSSIVEAIREACGLSAELPSIDRREYFELDAWFALDGSILIRSGSRLAGISEQGQPDTVHLHSNHKNRTNVPIVSGTSLAGALRHRALKICNTISVGTDETKKALQELRAKSFVEGIFGVDMKELGKRNAAKLPGEMPELPFASRLEVYETAITGNAVPLVHSRVKIDRFTGGAYEGALFDAAPLFSNGDEPAVNLKLRLRTVRRSNATGHCETAEETDSRTSAEIGLFLLLLKDLWTSDLALGGESSIGRGRLIGKVAELKYKGEDTQWQTKLAQKGEIVEVMGDRDREQLNGFVAQLSRHLNAVDATTH